MGTVGGWASQFFFSEIQPRMAHATAQFFGGSLPTWGLGEGPKSQISLLSRIQRFLNQTLCVFSRMEDIKHIRLDFHSTAWVMLWEWDLGYFGGGGGGVGWVNFFSEIHLELVCELLT